MTTDYLANILRDYLLNLRSTSSVSRTPTTRSNATASIHLVTRGPIVDDSIIEHFDITITRRR